MRAIVDLLVPHRCVACGSVVAAPGPCDACRAELDAVALPDLGAVQLATGVVAVAAYAYEGVARAALLGVKVGGRFAGLPALGVLMRARLRLPGPDVAPVTWVPSHPSRRRERGVEVPMGLAGPGAVPLLHVLDRRPDQTALSAQARRRNVRGVFRVRGAVPEAVIVVDDVRTTGATATAAALALQAAGARRVLVATLCAASAVS